MYKPSLLLLITVLVLLQTACSAQATPVPTTIPWQATSVQLSWIHSIEFAGFYMAQKEGSFATEGLNVTLKPGGYDAEGREIKPIEEVLAGHADFGIIDGSLLLTARAEGKPIVALTTIYQRHPLALLSLDETGIVRPEDLIGKTIQMSEGSQVIFQAFLLSEGLDPAQITIVPRTDFTTAPLLSGEADGIDGWVTNELVELTLGGHKVNTLLFSDYGIDLYPNVIFTTEETIAQRPDLVEHVVHALLSGLQSAIDNPETAMQTTITYNPDLDAEKELIGMQQSLPLILPAGSHLGTMQPEVWTFMHQTLLDLGLLKTPMDLEASYTLQFLPFTIEAGK